MDATRYYGELVQRRVAGPFVVTESVFRGGSKLPMHSHESSYFTFTLKGSYHERYGSQSRLCTPGTGVGHPAHENHSQVFDREPALLMRLALAENASESSVNIEVDQPAALTSPLLARAVWQLHHELQRCDGYTETIVEELAYELAGCTLRSTGLNGGSRKRARHAQTLIRSSLRCPAPIAVIAAELGVSRATLYRDFKCAFGCSPGEYVRRARIDVAVDALSKSRRPVADIAAECGFYDQSHFDRCFKFALGVSPSAYRRSVR
jgi:AraC family transcriptional regulator